VNFAAPIRSPKSDK